MDLLNYQLGRKRKYKCIEEDQLYTYLLVTFLEVLPRIAQGKRLEIRRTDLYYHIQYGEERRIYIARSQLSRPLYEILDCFIQMHPMKERPERELDISAT